MLVLPDEYNNERRAQSLAIRPPDRDTSRDTLAAWMGPIVYAAMLRNTYALQDLFRLFGCLIDSIIWSYFYGSR